MERMCFSETSECDMPYKIETNLPPWLMLNLRDQFKLERFVETGTACGDTAALAALAFSRVDTIEISRGQFERADKLLKDMLNVKRWLGDSQAVLRALDKSVPTLFWLDAHWTGGSRELMGDVECPLLGELEAIGGLRNKHVVLIDDANLFKTPSS